MLSQLWEFLQEAQAQADASTRNGDAENMVERLFQDAVGRTTRPSEAEPSTELLEALMQESTSSEGYAAAGDSPIMQSSPFGGKLLDESGPGSFSRSNAPIAPYETADTRRQKENEETRRLETELQKLLLGERHRLALVEQGSQADIENEKLREQDERIQQLEQDLKDAIKAYRELNNGS
jgi:hypothetical protein